MHPQVSSDRRHMVFLGAVRVSGCHGLYCIVSSYLEWRLELTNGKHHNTAKNTVQDLDLKNLVCVSVRLLKCRISTH